ncbi:MAG: NAD kinase [Alphaproteobacteria bacterium]|nr:NAD kinase [Alphaproteobacteria bacterium]OJV15770.1 MAG: NAD kinase [Alphaproteobacteria bacterium 33-17]
MQTFVIYNDTPKTIETYQKLTNHIKANTNLDDAKPGDLILVLGGDGFMLRTLHNYMGYGFKFYGINTGTVGFLLNEYTDNIIEKIQTAELSTLHPLKLRAKDQSGMIHEKVAINEVSLFRQTNQSAKLEVHINQKLKIPEISGDGVIIATPAGSSAYNFSAGGPIMPIESNLIALTAINAYYPKRWKSALLPINSVIDISVLENSKRPVNVSADFFEIHNVVSVNIQQEQRISIDLLFDHDHNLEDRLINEQFKV